MAAVDDEVAIDRQEDGSLSKDGRPADDEMTNRYTDQEWQRIIASTHAAVLPRSKHPSPTRNGHTNGSSTNGSSAYSSARHSSVASTDLSETLISSSSSPVPTYRVPGLTDPAFTKTIDHTLLKLEAKANQIDDLCAEARVHGFATVCVRVNWVERCVKNLKGSGVGVACVVGFHEGTYELSKKLSETKTAISAGASELDVVINVPDLQAQSYTKIFTELCSIRQSAPPPTLIKLILETSLLTPSQIIAASVLAGAANLDFIKTSTGFLGPNSGAKLEDVQLMKRCCEKLVQGERREMKVKASGGIRTLKDAIAMLEAGAERLGTSGGVWIAKEAEEAAERSQSPPSVLSEKGRERPLLATRLYTDY